MTIGVAALVLGLQLSGALQLFEFAVLNQWFRLRPPEAITVPIVIVTITEDDLRQAGRWPLSDAQLAALLNRVKRDRPAAIGLDLYRDLPVEPGHAALTQVFSTTPNLIGITKAVISSESPGVAAAPALSDRGQIAINDLLLDSDGIVRRNLISVQQNGREIPALGTRLALMYLSQQGIAPQPQSAKGCVRLGQAEFCRLLPDAGGYVRADTGGYQTLSNFLRIPGGIPTFTLAEVMTDRIPRDLLRGKLVLIGSKAESLWGDRFFTPYSIDSTSTWAGVEIHANLAAQLIASATTGRPVLQGLSQGKEWGWILLWTGAGTALGWGLRSLLGALILTPLALVSMVAIGYGSFLIGWWTIVVAPLLGFMGAGLFSRSYWVWRQLRQANQLLELKVQERTLELTQKNRDLEQAQRAAEAANRALERLSRIDELTQIANRRFFNEFLDQAWNQMVQQQLPISLILADVDFFKLYNDTYGHPAGDECLFKLASTLKAAIRLTDLVARYGGEEFAIVLPNTSLQSALEFAATIQAEVKTLQIPHRGSQVSPAVTLSLGVVSMVPTAQSGWSQLVSQADQALYRAKVAGRDRAMFEQLVDRPHQTPEDPSSPTQTKA